MALFPMFVDLSEQYCLVLGGGRVALRKIRTLIAAGADVHVWSEEICEDIHRLAEEGSLKLEDRSRPAEHFLSGAFLVVCATSDHEFNRNMVILCRERHIYVNCATSEALEDENSFGHISGKKVTNTSFVFPSLIMRDNISIGISTWPSVPSLSKHIREQLDHELPLWYDSFGRSLAEYRTRLRRLVSDPCARGRVMGRLTEYGIYHEGNMPEKIFIDFVNEENKKL